MAPDLDMQAIDRRWQERWEREGLFRTPEHPDPARRFYLLEMFAYPSGDIHIGHFRNYTIGDVVWRYQRMRGKDLLHPFGWDAFGLPAEQAAIKHGVHPSSWTERNIATSRTTLQRLGISYDWDREVVTCRSDYYRWTQWMFLQLHRRGLSYQEEASVNWCPACNTVLANEQVSSDGTCWRHTDTRVEQRYLKQWYFRITEYAQQLLDGLDTLVGSWPDSTIAMQRNWIGRSTGAEIRFEVVETGDPLPVFTTRPDTIYGVTFMAIAPDARLMRSLLPVCPNREQVEAYTRTAQQRSEIERTAEDTEKDGVDTGLHVRNPFNNEEVPLYVADYVLAGYGSGAVMAVPAHDQRDFEFARRYGIPIRTVIRPADGEPLDPASMTEAYVGDGIMHDSGPFDGVPNREGITRTAAHAEAQGFGKSTVQYRLRDWLLSRQRYWGAPIPIIHCQDCGAVPVPEDALPVLLPEVTDVLPRGRSPLEDVEEFMTTTCPRCQQPARRDPDTMDTFVCSAWYHLRYADARNEEAPWDLEKLDSWMPVDLYIGGSEHATGHLIYFRFLTRVLHDAGWCPVQEPVRRLFHHGMVYDEHGDLMSKSKGNVVSPVELIEEWGVDIPRTAMLFFAPPAREIHWSSKGMVGVKRFFNRVQAMVDGVASTAARLPDGEVPPYPWTQAPAGEQTLLRKLHQTIRKVTQDLEEIQFNTSVAALMELLNEWETAAPDAASPLALHVAGTYVKLLGPFAPHLGEELWARLGGAAFLFQRPWPEYEEAACIEETVTVAVQVRGKLRGTFEVPRGTTEEHLLEMVYADERLAHLVGPRDQLRKVIHVPDRILNIVP